MSIDQATLKVNFEADLAKANQAVQILGDIKNALNALGNVKGVADLKSVVADLDKKFGDVAKKLGSINIDNVKTTKSVKAIEDERKALQELNAELTVYLSKTNQMIDKNRSIRGAANAIYGASPILDRRDEPISKANVLSMTRKVTQIVAERAGITLEKAAKAVETAGLDKEVRTKIGRAPNFAVNTLVSATLKGIAATAEAERAQLQAIKDRQEQVRRVFNAAANAYKVTKTQNLEFGRNLAKEIATSKRQSALWKDYFNTEFGDFNQRYRPGMSREQRMASLSDRGKLYSSMFGIGGEQDRRNELREMQQYENMRRRAYGAQMRDLGKYVIPSIGSVSSGRRTPLEDAKKSELFNVLQSFGLRGENPFVANLTLTHYKERINTFLKQIVGEVKTLPEDIRARAEMALRQLGSGSVGMQSLLRKNQVFYMENTGFNNNKNRSKEFQGNNLTGVQTGIRFYDTDENGNKIRMMWQGSEAAFLKYHATLQANKVEPEKFAPPKTTIAAWLNLKDSAAQVGQSIYGVLKDIEQPFTSIAISFSRIAYGLRTIQMGLIQFGATFTAVIGGATYAAQNFASSILEVTEIQKKAQITLEGVFGDKGLAQNITTFARQYAIETPATFREVTNMVKSFGFIPEIKKQILDVRGDAKALDKTLKDMAYTTIALGLTKPEQGIEGAVFSIREALAGQFRSLKMRFEMPMSAVAATVGMTEGQLKEDPKRIMEALKNFMDINVGEDTIKKLYRTFSTQLQNITDVFEKAKVAIGQSGFEEAMEQMAFNVASALEGMLDTNKFKQQLQGISGLMTEFGRKMFGYGKALGWALVGGDKQMTAAQIRPFTEQADKLAAKGQFGSKQDYMDFVETQLLVATATDKISVAYNALLKILDSVVPRITSLITELVGNQARIDQLTNNLITFLDMLFSVADGMLKLIMGAVTFINNLPIGNVGKTLALFAMAFPVATFQTGFAAVNMLIKSIIMLGKITATNNLANVGTSLVKLSTDLGVFLTNMTTGRTASNAMLASAGVNSVAGFFMGGGKAVAAKNVGAQAGVYTSEGFMAAGAAGAGAARMGFMRGGAIAAAILGIGVFAEKLTGINSIFSVTADLLGTVFVGALRLVLTAINGWVDAVKMITSAIMGMYGWITEQVKGLNPFGKEKPRSIAAINKDIERMRFGDKMGIKDEWFAERQLQGLLSERDKAIAAGAPAITGSKALGPLEHIQKVFEGLSWFSKDAGKAVSGSLVPSIEELGKQAEGQAKLIESLAGKTNTNDLFKNKSRSDFAGLSQYFASTNIGDIVDSVDKFRLKDEFLNLQKLKSNYESFLKAPKGIAESQFTSFLDEKQFKFGAKGWREQYKKLMDEFDFSKHMEDAKTPLLFEQRNAGFKLMIQDAEKKADVVRQANDDIRQSQIRILELQDNGIQAKFKANALEIESKREELNLTQAIAQATLQAAIAAETDAGKRQALVLKMIELVNLQKTQNSLLNEEAALRDRATAIKEVGPALKKFGMDASSMQKPEAYAQFADYINKSKALQEHIGKMEAQNLKRSAEARETLKATITAEYEEALNLLSAAILAESGAIEQSFASLYEQITSGFSTLAFDVQSSVDNFAAQVVGALDGMNIVVNVNAVVNAITNMVTGAVDSIATSAQTGGTLLNAITRTGTALYGIYKESKAAKDEAKRRMGPLGDPSAYKPGGGGGDKKESLEERNRMLKEIADSQYVGDELRKTAFHGYNENDYKKKIEEINKMKTAGVLKEVEAQQYLAAIKTEYDRKELEFIRKLESERAKELTQYLSVITEAENNPLVSGAGLYGMKKKLMALEIAEGFKEIEFKAKNAAESIKVMNEQMLIQVGLTKEDALNLVKKSEELERQNLVMKLRRENATGFEKGVLNLPSAKETFEKAQEEFISTLSSGLSDALANALDPDSNESFRESMSKLGKALRRTVIKAFTDALVNNLIRGLFGGGEGQGGIVGSLTAAGKEDPLKSTVQSLTQGLGGMAVSANKNIALDYTEAAAANTTTGALYGLTAAANSAASKLASMGGSSGGGGLLGDLFSFGSAGSMNDFSSSVAGSMTGGFGNFGGVLEGSLNNLSARFAEGGIVSKPTLSLIGEGGEPEAVAPFSKFAKLLKERDNKAPQESQPVSVNVVNVVDPQMVNKAIMNDPNTVINVVASDMQNRGTTYQIMRGRR